MLLPKSVVCTYNVLSLSLQGFVWSKYHFWPFFGPDIIAEMGVVIYRYLKRSSDYIDSKYIWFMGLTPLVQVFLLKYYFWHF